MLRKGLLVSFLSGLIFLSACSDPAADTSEYVDLTWRQGRDEMSARIDTPRHQPSGATGPVRLHYAIHRDGTATVEVVARR
jgi:hypothetical protein